MKQSLQAALAKFGYQLTRLSSLPNDGLTCFFQATQRAGFAPLHIVYMGANRVNWTRPGRTPRRPYFPSHAPPACLARREALLPSSPGIAKGVTRPTALRKAPRRHWLNQ